MGLQHVDFIVGPENSAADFLRVFDFFGLSKKNERKK